MSVIKGFINLVKGMQITGKHLGRHAVTVQYPEQRDNIPERSRGVVVLLSDKETGELNCTSCLLCSRVCPTAAITIDSPRGEDKKRHLKAFTVDNTLCCYCGLCEEVCNFCAIKLATMYEFSTLDKNDLVWDKEKLQEMGRDVPYEDTRKKKPAAAAKPAAKPATEKKEEAAKPVEEKPAVTEKPAEAKPAEAAKPDQVEEKKEPEKKDGPDAPAEEQ